MSCLPRVCHHRVAGIACRDNIVTDVAVAIEISAAMACTRYRCSIPSSPWGGGEGDYGGCGRDCTFPAGSSSIARTQRRPFVVLRRAAIATAALEGALNRQLVTGNLCLRRCDAWARASDIGTERGTVCKASLHALLHLLEGLHLVFHDPCQLQNLIHLVITTVLSSGDDIQLPQKALLLHRVTPRLLRGESSARGHSRSPGACKGLLDLLVDALSCVLPSSLHIAQEVLEAVLDLLLRGLALLLQTLESCLQFSKQCCIALLGKCYFVESPAQVYVSNALGG
mmetsp:Transcript_9832/g.20855  ORF Transcript_9832/g.20855 Transcript_9832/m.20855 type:complete len:283 (+) Transcript_9832:505-1353(+)